MDSARDQILRAFDDTGELIFGRHAGGPPSSYDAHWYAWDEAHDDATAAYDAWCHDRGRTCYVVYRAAQDRADAAQEALARFMRGDLSDAA